MTSLYMKIFVNGEEQQVKQHITVTDLIDSLELTGTRLALELNQEILPRGRYSDTELRDGDQIEIVHAIGGG